MKGYVPDKIKIFVLERDGWRCQECGIETPKELRGSMLPNAPEVDHIIPKCKKGKNDVENLRGVCKSCNGAQGGRLQPHDVKVKNGKIGGKIAGGINAKKPNFLSDIGKLGSHEDKVKAGRLGGIRGAKNQPREAKVLGALVANHKRHQAKGIIKNNCKFCTELINGPASVA